MRVATFFAGEDSEQVECSLVTLRGEAGGLAANVKRWMGQLDLDVAAAGGLEAFLSRQEAFTTEGGDGGVLVDLTELGEDAAAPSMLVGVVTRPGQTIFAKMTGSKSGLRAQRPFLLQLCVSFE